MHHSTRSTPSGTAAVRQRRCQGAAFRWRKIRWRVRRPYRLALPPASIGFARALRGGSVIGEHQVMLAGEGETVTPQRDGSLTFACVLVKAALWAREEAWPLFHADVPAQSNWHQEDRPYERNPRPRSPRPERMGTWKNLQWLARP